MIGSAWEKQATMPSGCSSRSRSIEPRLELGGELVSGRQPGQPFGGLGGLPGPLQRGGVDGVERQALQALGDCLGLGPAGQRTHAHRPGVRLGEFMQQPDVFEGEPTGLVELVVERRLQPQRSVQVVLPRLQLGDVQAWHVTRGSPRRCHLEASPGAGAAVSPAPSSYW